jgi:glycosyltransferase involved in cell wall biosynthesis
MPVFNEAQGIRSFLTELFDVFQNEEIKIHVTDDFSTDGTKRLLQELGIEFGSKLSHSVNAKNLGHGPSTLAGINHVIDNYNFNFLITVDGDGNFHGEDIYNAFKIARETGCEILEGVRTFRNSPIFRLITTKCCQKLVKQISNVEPKDANTPLRIYKSEVIRVINKTTPRNLLTPNIFISALSRLSNFEIIEFKISVIESRSMEKLGTTWKQKISWLPSTRFIHFCYSAVSQWRNQCTSILKQIRK